jgi:trans-AT polyketide synthase, acyltransferase and oxidoreductase domains
MGFLGIGGMEPGAVEASVRQVHAALGPGRPYGVNLLYAHGAPHRELALVDLLLHLGVGVVEASGFLRVTPALVKYRLHGGRILAKVSRLDAAAAFLAPPPERLVRQLLDRGEITSGQAAQAAGRPAADDLCVEAGSGWLADTASLTALLSAVVRLRDSLTAPEVGACRGGRRPGDAASGGGCVLPRR